jgi:hypothetical protein
MKLRVATCKELPEPDGDAEPLAAALAEAGFDARWVAWDDPDADWDEPIPTILRSTWNYARDVDAFLAWIERAARAAPLVNPPDIVRGNVHKRYLLELAARGVPVVETTIIERDARSFAIPPHDRFVLKPEVGAGSLDTKVFSRGDAGAGEHLMQILARCDAMIQPYLASIEDYGERAIVWIDGELTHAVRKTPRFAGEVENVEGPFPIADAERAIALAALAPYADSILYGRVDLARADDGSPLVSELELVEPSLFFTRGPGAAARYASALRKRLG